MKNKVLGILSIIFMYTLFFLVVGRFDFLKFTYDILIFASIVIIFISLHFFLNIKKMYNFIFDKRYIISIGIFIILVIGGYNGSSIGMLNRYIDTNDIGTYDMPILGYSRGIRSDEWAVGTLTNLSQEYNNYSNVNDMMRAEETKVDFYPRNIVKDYAIIMHPEQIGYLFLPLENAFSFAWYFPIIAAFLIAIELFMIITKKNKLLSFLGAVLTIVAPATLWWQSPAYTLYGGLALIVIYNFINTNDKKMKVMLAVILGWIASCYLTIMYPAWMIPYAYFYVIIFIWMIIDNKDKIKLKDSLYLLISLIVCASLFLPVYINSRDVYNVVMQTEYPGKRVSTGGGSDYRLLLVYILNFFFPYTDKVVNPCELSQYISLFPIPIIMAIYYLIKNKKENKKIDYLLLLMTTYTLFLLIWTLIPLPNFISKITLLSMSTSYRSMNVVSYSCVFILIYLINNYQSNKKENKKSIVLFILSIISTIFISILSTNLVNELYENSISKLITLASIILFTPTIYLLINNNKKTNDILVYSLLFLSFISCILIMPINKGLSVVKDKPFAREIQRLVSENPNKRFLAISDDIVMPNYILANGAKTINSTNFVPNLTLWEKIDKNNKYKEIYNRYSHVFISLTNEETSFELLQVDNYKINLNYHDICKLNPDYLVSRYELDESEYYENIYDLNNMYIYKTICN